MINIYRDIEFSVWNKHFIKLFDIHGVKRDGKSYLRNGELYISIPPAWAKRPDLYAKRQIDMLFDRMQYHEEQEKRAFLR